MKKTAVIKELGLFTKKKFFLIKRTVIKPTKVTKPKQTLRITI